ncbi:hypothetical protein cypCar_00034839 [Cyprinus carpio]|nr:hypothetical protein cypCar_00034839 [Cyprinus carpio]
MSAQANRVMALSEWEDRWNEGKTGFHRPEVHNLLENNLDKVICGRKEVRFFFPLCGKAVDMKWLADMGHTVVGVEISEKGIKQFFAEQNLAFNEEPVAAIPGANVFKVSEGLAFVIYISADGKISIYQCDLYKFSSGIVCKYILSSSPRYATLLMSLMNNDCRYLLDTVEYNSELYKGPPFVVSEEDVKNEFGGGCDIELLESVDAFGEKYKSVGLDSLTEKVYLLSLKAQ